MTEAIHARLRNEDRQMLKELKRTTGESVSALIKRGLALLYRREVAETLSAFDLAEKYCGKYSSPIRDLSFNQKHLEGYGK